MRTKESIIYNCNSNDRSSQILADHKEVDHSALARGPAGCEYDPPYQFEKTGLRELLRRAIEVRRKDERAFQRTHHARYVLQQREVFGMFESQ